jgi:hypothetical protein
VECENKSDTSIRGATGPSQTYRKCLSQIPGKDDMKGLLKTVTLGAAVFGKNCCKSKK